MPFRPRFFSALSTQGRAYPPTAKPVSRAAVIDFLLKCRTAEKAKLDSDPVVLRQFSRAANAIANLPPGTQLVPGSKIRGVGAAMKTLVDRYLTNQDVNSDASNEIISSPKKELAMLDIIKELRSLPTIGTSTARMLVENGCRDIAHLKSSPELLDLLTPIQRANVATADTPHATRSEAESVMAFMATSLSEKYDVLLIGDYRRGAKDFPAIEVLVSRSDFVYVPKPAHSGSKDQQCLVKSVRNTAVKSHLALTSKEHQSPLHKDVTPRLEERGFIVNHLNARDNVWVGNIRLPDEQSSNPIKWKDGEVRKLVIRIVSPKSLGAALIHFTGDIEFIRDIRIKASRLGLYLDDFGLWKWQEANNDDEGFWKMIKAHTEEEIFETLGAPFVAPEKRNFLNIAGPVRKKKKKETPSLTL